MGVSSNAYFGAIKSPNETIGRSWNLHPHAATIPPAGEVPKGRGGTFQGTPNLPHRATASQMITAPEFHPTS